MPSTLTGKPIQELTGHHFQIQQYTCPLGLLGIAGGLRGIL